MRNVCIRYCLSLLTHCRTIDTCSTIIYESYSYKISAEFLFPFSNTEYNLTYIMIINLFHSLNLEHVFQGNYNTVNIEIWRIELFFLKSSLKQLLEKMFNTLTDKMTYNVPIAFFFISVFTNSIQVKICPLFVASFSYPRSSVFPLGKM